MSCNFDNDRDICRDKGCSFEDILDSLDDLNRRQFCKLLKCIEQMLKRC
jgi:hypothetical protein